MYTDTYVNRQTGRPARKRASLSRRIALGAVGLVIGAVGCGDSEPDTEAAAARQPMVVTTAMATESPRAATFEAGGLVTPRPRRC